MYTLYPFSNHQTTTSQFCRIRPLWFTSLRKSERNECVNQIPLAQKRLYTIPPRKQRVPPGSERRISNPRVFRTKIDETRCTLILAPRYRRLLTKLRACVRTASSKWYFCDIRRPSFELWTESGELMVICRAISSAVGTTADFSTTMFTLGTGKYVHQ